MERIVIMKWFAKLQDRLKGLTYAIVRYPLTELFLITAAVIIAGSIQTDADYRKQLLVCLVGAVLSVSLQAAYERFFNKAATRYILMGSGILLTLGYYLILRPAPELSMEIGIRTWVVIFALCIAFIWVPVIRSNISFNESFMAAFKAFFHAIFYAIVIYAGCTLIFLAIDNLLVHVSDKAFAHIGNIVFVLFAPLYFLSLIPVYPGKKNSEMNAGEIKAQEEQIYKASFCPQFLEILISYIIIPITAVYTFILMLYIAQNIRGEFWTNNLLEPMLVFYAITVILLNILSSRLENKFALLFRMIFPKVLIPIVLFQIVSSILILRETGVTHTRYFVILFGIFAVCSSILMSFTPVRKNGAIAAMLIAFSIVSVIPPTDAFTVSRISQENTLKSLLIKNRMLKNDTIVPNTSISDADKRKIVSAAEYLNSMAYTDTIAWMPDDFSMYEDFYDTFGFYEYDLSEKKNRYINVFMDSSIPIDIAGYDILTHTYMNSDENADTRICEIEKSGKKYMLERQKAGETYDIILRDSNNQEMIRFHADEIFSKYQSYAADKSAMGIKEATFSTENNQVRLTVVVQDANINVSFNQTYYYADLYILVQFK